jgi:hypothetical protein
LLAATTRAAADITLTDDPLAELDALIPLGPTFD